MVKENVAQIRREIPEGVVLVAAAKTRTPQEILEAVDAGITIVGENYVKEAEAAFAVVGDRCRWHMIGHLQRNKVKRAVELFDMIETVDSLRLAREIEKRCARIGKVMPVLIEINSGREPQKTGVLPERAVGLIREIAALPHLQVRGLMTMGPRFGDPEAARPYFVETRRLFEEIEALKLSGIEMKVLSMGMSNTYKIAIEEGATLVRVGTKLFGERDEP
jgi:pyridoxal phosphate enzyme (YggS family)